jgi:hypothetical protein
MVRRGLKSTKTSRRCVARVSEAVARELIVTPSSAVPRQFHTEPVSDRRSGVLAAC